MRAARWLIDQRAVEHSPASLIAGLAAELERDGLPILRISAWLPTQHPELWGTQLFWRRGHGFHSARRPLDIYDTATFQGTPGQAVVEGGRPLRCRLDVPPDRLRFPMLAEIAAEGGVDYLITPLTPPARLHLPRGSSRAAAVGDQVDVVWISYATDRATGFSDQEVSGLEELAVSLCFHFQLLAERYAKRSLLEVYLGPNAARHVLAGAFHRGTGTMTRAAIWFCDLRGFTALGDHLPARELVAILDAYFECVADPIEEHGGEILKFIGDAALAIFPIGEGGPADPCRHAHAAAEAALANLDSLDTVHPGWPRLAMGIALHVGEVLYGNVGGTSRLDFTVIGRAVNEVSRIEPLCKQLATPLLMTGAFAAALESADIVPLGDHQLRGVSAAHALYTTRRHAPP